jgi:hypothetical protein
MRACSAAGTSLNCCPGLQLGDGFEPQRGDLALVGARFVCSVLQDLLFRGRKLVPEALATRMMLQRRDWSR